MERKSLIDATSSHAAKPVPVESTEKSSKGLRNAILVVLFVILLGTVAAMYWHDIFPEKVKPADIGPNATDPPPPPTPAPPPRDPGQPPPTPAPGEVPRPVPG